MSAAACAKGIFMKTKWISTLLLFLLLATSIHAFEHKAEAKKPMTFSMIKPGAVKEGHTGAILALIEKANLQLAALKMVKLSKEDAARFYAEHKGKPFYDELVDMMSSGPIVAMVVEGEDAVRRLRDIVGATDPKKA